MVWESNERNLKLDWAFTLSRFKGVAINEHFLPSACASTQYEWLLMANWRKLMWKISVRSTLKPIRMIWGLEIFSNHFCLTIIGRFRYKARRISTDYPLSSVEFRRDKWISTKFISQTNFVHLSIPSPLSNVLITDVESELSDLSNATNRVKFNWKQVKKQRVMVGATPKRIFNNTYNNNFS